VCRLAANSSENTQYFFTFLPIVSKDDYFMNWPSCLKTKQIFLFTCILHILLTSCNGRIVAETSNSTAIAIAAENLGTQTVVARTQAAKATEQAIPTNTLTPTILPTPKITPTPTLIPLIVQGWDQYTKITVQTLCLDVSLDYPQFNHDLEVPVQEVIATYLKSMGYDLVEAGGDCDATLTIQLELRSEADQYQDNQTNEKMTCYSGSSTEGFMLLEAPGRKPLEYPISKFYAPFTVFDCVTQPDPKSISPRSWGPEIISGIVEFWGISAALATLRTSSDHLPAFIAQDAALGNWGKYSDDVIVLLPYLMTIVEHGGPTHDKSVKAALDILGNLGSEALPAVPYLIQGLEYELDSPDPSSCPWCIVSILEAITGQQVDKLKDPDPDFWWDWWEANKPAE
jgi:hypothetical protein